MRLLFVLLACTPEASDTVRDGPSQDNFANATSVRIISPEQGASVGQDLQLRYQAGDKVASIALEIDGERAKLDWPAEAQGSLDLDLSPGRQELSLVAMDAQGQEISRDAVDVKVLSDDETSAGWVAITSPSDGSHPVNPVQFVVDGSAGVARVEFLADDWPLGTVTPGNVLTYSFNGTGYSREIVANGYDSDGGLVASDSIAITVESSGTEVPPSDFSELVLDLVESYPKDGTYGFYWPMSGSWSGGTRDLYYQDRLIGGDGGYSACYCSGITWEWYFRAWQEYDKSTGGDGEDLNGLSDDEVMDMRLYWYVEDLDGPGPSVALEAYGLGREVESMDDWTPGDFIQFWRTSGSGHTAVFMGWVEDDDSNRIGIEYASCQGSTDGLGVNDEYFGTHSGAIDPLLMYVGRPYLPDMWF